MDDQEASDEWRSVPDNRPVPKPDPGPMFADPDQFGHSLGEREQSGAVVPFKSDPIDDGLEFTDELTQSVLEVVLEDEAVEERLSDHRYEAVGLVRENGKNSEKEDRPIVLVIADYSTNTALEISVTEDGNDVIGISESHQQTALSPNEIERALKLLNDTEQVEDTLPPHSVQDAFLASPSVPSHSRYRHRGVVLTFDATAAERFTHRPDATHVAEIDLSRGEVLDVREIPDVPAAEIAPTIDSTSKGSVDE